ncbi:aspartate aminotransferase [Diplonema papillatum]|nr:aspartate aminotransferase [Diplonema papillatum]
MTPVVEAPRPANEEERKADAPDSAVAAAHSSPTVTRLTKDFSARIPLSGKVATKSVKTFRFFDDPSNLVQLENGTAFYTFACMPGTALSKQDKDLISRTINLTAFPADHEDFVANIDMEDPVELRNIFMLTKAMYVLPQVSIDLLNPALLANIQYQNACEPGTCKVWEDCTEPDTFRITKTIVRGIYKMTVQFKCTLLPPEVFPSLEVVCDGLAIDKAILLERTKRDRTRADDSTKKVRSLLLYHSLGSGGVVVTNFTCVANTSIPSLVARLADKLGWAGASEVGETAQKTRDYLLKPKKAKK